MPPGFIHDAAGCRSHLLLEAFSKQALTPLFADKGKHLRSLIVTCVHITEQRRAVDVCFPELTTGLAMKFGVPDMSGRWLKCRQAPPPGIPALSPLLERT
jgi:hypothetical protein